MTADIDKTMSACLCILYNKYRKLYQEISSTFGYNPDLIDARFLSEFRQSLMDVQKMKQESRNGETVTLIFSGLTARLLCVAPGALNKEKAVNYARYNHGNVAIEDDVIPIVGTTSARNADLLISLMATDPEKDLKNTLQLMEVELKKLRAAKDKKVKWTAKKTVRKVKTPSRAANATRRR
jgi:hypothetical protein